MSTPSGRWPHVCGDTLERIAYYFEEGDGQQMNIEIDRDAPAPVVIVQAGRVVHRLSVEDCIGHIRDLSDALLRLGLPEPSVDPVVPERERRGASWERHGDYDG
jgi:hypothetical protein